MAIRELFLEIFERYPQEYQRDNKVSNSYFKELKQRILQVFRPLLRFQFEINALGGQGIMRKNPYICFLAKDHQTNRGFYPAYFFDFENQGVIFGFDSAHDHEPPEKLVSAFAACAAELLPEFNERDDDEYPRKIYAKDELDEQELLEDLEAAFKAYETCLEEFDEEIQEYLKPTMNIDPNQMIFPQVEQAVPIIFDEQARYWTIAPGENARLWEDFKQNNIIAIGWDELGDLLQYPNKEAIRQALQEIEGTESYKTNDTLACYEFTHIMQIGDYVFAKKGVDTIIGFGQVTSDYFYDNSRVEYHHVRRLNWLSIGNWKIPEALGKITLKTLTDFTKYPDFVRKIITLITSENFGTQEAIQRLLDSFLAWFEGYVSYSNEIVEEYQQFSQEYFNSLNDQELIDLMVKFAQDGGKIQSGGHRTAPMFRESITAQTSEFRQLILSMFDDNFDVEQWWKHADSFKGFGKGIRSIFLHRVFPDRFAIFNNKSRDAFQLLGLLHYKPSSRAFEYNLINEAAQKLIAYRPEQLNFYRVDALTEYLLGPSQGKLVFEKLILQQERTTPDNEQEKVLAPINYWWLNANPKIWDFNAVMIGEKETYTSYNEIGHKRQIYNAFAQVKPGDIMLGYVTSPQRNLVAICQITKGLHNSEEGECIEFEKIEQFKNPINFTELQAIPELKNCRPLINNQGSLFPITVEEYEIIRAIIDEHNPPLGPQEPKQKFSKADALANLFLNETEFDNILNLLHYKKNIILQGPPGVGKSFIAKQIAFALMEAKDEERVTMIQFHQAYSYEDFIQGFRPNDDGKFILKNGVFYEFCKKAQRNPAPHVFIIDEINRGNLSKIFGELMLLIEPDKRGSEFAMPLTYSPHDVFFLPENLYIIGLMNTADRSLAMVDYALRRRFVFIELPPQFESEKFRMYLNKHGVSDGLIGRLVAHLTSLNQQITEDKNLGKGFCIGHSFFCPNRAQQTYDDRWYQQVIKYEIQPLLEEYWFDDIDKAVATVRRLLV